MDYEKIYGSCGGCGNYRMLDDKDQPCPKCQSNCINTISDDKNYTSFFNKVTNNGEELPRFIVKPESPNTSVMNYLEEKKLYTKARSELKDSEFGLPKLRNYPLIDKEHIKKAIQFFKYCPPENKKELAKNILKKIKEFNLEDEIHVSKDNPYKKYFPDLVSESYDAIIDIDNITNIVESGDIFDLLNIYESLDYINESGFEETLHKNLTNYYSNIKEITIEEATQFVPLEKIEQERMKPIFITLTGGTKLGSNIIKGFTGSDYSHSGISLDTNFDRIYTFNTPGFVVENLKSYQFINNYAIYMKMVPLTIYNRIKYFIENLFMKNQDKYKYNNMVVASVPLKANIKPNNFKFFCSEFVDYILKISGIDITKKDSTKVTPKDFSQTKELILVDKGLKDEIDISKIKKKIKNFLGTYENKIVQEMSSNIEIKADSDGVFIIKKKEKLDFMNFYSRSHRLLIEYEKVNNIKSIKYELAKLWFMNVVIERKVIYTNFIFKDQKRIEDAKKARAFILNDFTKYLRLVLSKEPDFNFQEYYEKTEFGVETYKIDKNAIILMGEVIKKIITGV
jgi:hypothetical protein